MHYALLQVHVASLHTVLLVPLKINSSARRRLLLERILLCNWCDCQRAFKLGWLLASTITMELDTPCEVLSARLLSSSEWQSVKMSWRWLWGYHVHRDTCAWPSLSNVHFLGPHTGRLNSLLSRHPRPESSCDVLLCAYTIKEVRMTRHPDRYTAHMYCKTWTWGFRSNNLGAA